MIVQQLGWNVKVSRRHEFAAIARQEPIRNTNSDIFVVCPLLFAVSVENRNSGFGTAIAEIPALRFDLYQRSFMFHLPSHWPPPPPPAEFKDTSSPWLPCPPPSQDRLENFPVTFFAVMMGLLGLVLSMTAAEKRPSASGAASQFHPGCRSRRLTPCSSSSTASSWSATPRQSRPSGTTRSASPSSRPSRSRASARPPALAQRMPDLAYVVWSVGVGAQGILALSVVANWIGPPRLSAAAISRRPGSSRQWAMCGAAGGVQFGAVELPGCSSRPDCGLDRASDPCGDEPADLA